MSQQQSYPLAVIQFAQQQLSQYGRLGATKIVTTPALSAPIPGVVGSTQQAPLITWRDPGWAIALYAQTRAGTAPSFAQTDIRVQFPGDEDLITNGTAGDFAPMLSLVGPNVNWFPMIRRVERGDNWTITYKQAGVVAVEPSVLFAFIADADMARARRDAQGRA